MRTWLHFEFTNGSNPYILFLDHPKAYNNMFLWITAFDLELIPGFENFCFECIATENRINRKNYAEVKERIRDFAIEWQRITSEVTADYEYFSFWGGFFEYYGKKYGLLTEFRENAIC